MQAFQESTPRPVLAYAIDDRLYLNITDRCTLRCRFCPKHCDGPRVHDYDLTLPVRPTVEAVISAMGDPGAYDEVVFCGFGEPTLRLKTLLSVADRVKSSGTRVRLNTDGLANRVHKRNMLPQLSTCIDALSISMNAHNDACYTQHCDPQLPGSFQAMLDFLILAPRYVEDVTATAIDGLEGVDIDACRKLAEQYGVKFRRRVLDRVG